MTHLLAQLRHELSAQGSPQNVEGAQRFFKEKIDNYGLPMAATRLLAREFGRELTTVSKEALFDLCEQLWRSGKMEEAHIASFWTYSRRKEFTANDIDRFEKWIGHYVSNWANCDNFCNNVMGAYLLKFPEGAGRLEAWTASPNRWLRRAAAASLIVPARKGLMLDASLRIATLLLHDADDLVQKGYGWLLKEQCKKNSEAVYDFVATHKKEMPRTALRYAIEKAPAAVRKELLS
ncbi:MAG: DNA alkylation repair protein [Chitinophagaceae bacterium]|nr:MAG: DNA alkylation repair protein [Chitinophagaceae bacterium]